MALRKACAHRVRKATDGAMSARRPRPPALLHRGCLQQDEHHNQRQVKYEGVT